MRKTLTIDEDLIPLLQTRSEQEGTSFQEMVNATLRKALQAEHRRSRPQVVSHRFGFRPDIDTNKLGQLADELEIEAFAES